MDDPHLGYITKIAQGKMKKKNWNIEIFKKKKKEKKNFFFKENYSVEENRESFENFKIN